MITNQIAPQKALNPAYKKHKPSRLDIDNFIDKLEQCMARIEIVEERNESEEHLKSSIKRFLETTFYQKHEINTKDRMDLAICLGKDANSHAGVII